MLTLYEKVDALNPENSMPVFRKAAEIIKSGGIVIFPTETVYGIGADAFNESAVKKIYEAKGRPSDNPLIVHVSKTDDLNYLAANIPEGAKKLTDSFWPGPLTVILEKSANVPFLTTGGLNTVALRLPQSKAARLFIEACGCPVAAPSANISGKPSSTDAKHALLDFDGKVDMIIDGEQSVCGIESTIVDCSDDITLLRPGSVTFEMLRAVLPEIKADKYIKLKPDDDFKPKSPGQKYRHYAPKAEMTLFCGNHSKVVSEINKRIAASVGKRVGVLSTRESEREYNCGIVISAGSRLDPASVAANLYDTLRRFDETGVDMIYSETFGSEGIELAIMNRLSKAAGYRIVECK